MSALAMKFEDQPQMANALMPRATVETIVAARNRSLDLFSQAHASLTGAADAVTRAVGGLSDVTNRETPLNTHVRRDRDAVIYRINIAARDEYMAEARRIVDTEVWSHIVEVTDLERLMDKQAKEELRQQLIQNPPEVTLDNVYATLERFVLDAGTIFRRGIANCFSKLDRRFRSHDGFKIGSRLVLTRMFDENGQFNYHRDMESTLFDIERTFMVVDGKPVPAMWSGIVGQLRNARTGYRAQQTEIESEFFKVRAFKNGNCHVWFKRDDLVEKVNKMLAEYYGEAVGDAQTKDDGGLHDPKTTLAKNYGFFATPEATGDKLLDGFPLYREAGEPALTILEPSAGSGNLVRRILANVDKRQQQPTIDCVEVHRERFGALKMIRGIRSVYHIDFLKLQPSTTGKFDRVAMNPPFDLERDIDHVVHALDFLKDDGCLYAIMSAGTEFRETRKSIAFREMIAKLNGKFNDLPAGSFSSVGTNVNTIRLRVWKNGRSFW